MNQRKSIATSPSDLKNWASELHLSTPLTAELIELYQPLSDVVADRHAALGRPLRVGVNGAQGTGKSTLLALLIRLLDTRHGLHAAGLSLDDLYLTRAARTQLAASVHPLLQTRGVPGTHDVALGCQILDALCNGPPGVLAVPAFNKATDDRAPEAQWPVVEVPCDVVILEGWCVGAAPQAPSDLLLPCNELERTQDADGRYRNYVNQQLQGQYAALFSQFDLWVMLKAPDLDCVRSWRVEQEQALAKRLHTDGGPGRALSDREVTEFVAYFERLTCSMLQQMPGRADVVIELDRTHRAVQTHYNLSGAPT